MDEKVLTPEQVGQNLQVHPFTVLKFIKEGKLRASKLGRVYRIRESDVARFLDEQGSSETKDAKQNSSKQKILKKRQNKTSLTSQKDSSEKVEETSSNLEIDRSTVKRIDHYILE